MKNVFIDCGANIGWAVEFYKKIYPFNEWDYILIEPNPNCYKLLFEKYKLNSCIEILNLAVSRENKIYKFRYGSQLSEGGTIHDLKSAPNNDPYKNVVNINGITINDIINLVKDYNKKIIKIDIEGEEFFIMDQIINSHNYNYFSKYICEFHTQFMTENRENFSKKQNLIINFFKNKNYKIKTISVDQYLIEDDTLPSIQSNIVAH